MQRQHELLTAHKRSLAAHSLQAVKAAANRKILIKVRVQMLAFEIYLNFMRTSLKPRSRCAIKRAVTAAALQWLQLLAAGVSVAFI